MGEVCSLRSTVQGGGEETSSLSIYHLPQEDARTDQDE
jgi:hypothetical protein